MTPQHILLPNTAAQVPPSLGPWRMVPVKSTATMVAEVEDASRLGAVWSASWVYETMVSHAPLPPHQALTPEQARAAQLWTGMDGAVAFHLIERHGQGWADIGQMMDAWLEANRTHSASRVALLEKSLLAIRDTPMSAEAAAECAASALRDLQQLRTEKRRGGEHEMTTKTRELHERHLRLRMQMTQELAAVARAEFPLGTRVRWTRTYKDRKPIYCEGTVKHVGDWRMTVQTKSGATHEIDLAAAGLLAQQVQAAEPEHTQHTRRTP